MSFKRHKIFASGYHEKAKNKVWPPEKVLGVLTATKLYSPDRIPYTYRHPKNNLPVLGYASRESIASFEADSRTFLTIEPVDFAREMLPGLKQAGLDKVSIGLGARGEIVHIGITDIPSVDGLGAAFEASDNIPAVYAEEVEFEATELGNPGEAFEVSWKWQLRGWMQDVASLFQKMRDREIEANGLDAAEKYLPAYVLDYLKMDLAPDEPVDDAGPITTDQLLNKTFEKTDMDAKKLAELERLRTENATLLLQQSNAETARVNAEIIGFCAEHPDVVTPKIRDQVVAILTDLHGAQPRQFEAGGKTVEKTSFDLIKELIAGAKPQIVFDDVATKDKAADSEEVAGDPVLEVLTAQFEAAKKD